MSQRLSTRIFLLKFVHSLIYVFMSACLGYMFYAALTERYDWKLAFAIGMIVLETIILAISGWRCPLSTWARQLGDETGHDLLSDYLLPNWLARLTVPFCTLVFISALVLLLIMYLRN